MAISEVGRPLRLLIIEDVEDDAVLLRRELARSGYTLHWRRVQTEADLREALGAEAWDLVISDYDLPTFDALGALAVVRELGLDLPFIICSGSGRGRLRVTRCNDGFSGADGWGVFAGMGADVALDGVQ